VHQLLEDVRTTATVPNFPKPSPVAIRTILVPILRRWIVEGGFFAAQKLIAPTRIQFEVGINANAVRLCEMGYTERWMAIVLFGSIGVGVSWTAQSFIGKPAPCSGGEFRQLPHPAKTFFRQKMFFWKGRFFTRHDVIHAHANKLGGVHLDFQRAADQAHIDEIKNYFGFDQEVDPFRMLAGDKIARARADTNRRSNIYDAIELVTLDTARIFVKGIEDSKALFEALLR
jgi:hypothetical protein